MIEAPLLKEIAVELADLLAVALAKFRPICCTAVDDVEIEIFSEGQQHSAAFKRMYGQDLLLEPSDLAMNMKALRSRYLEPAVAGMANMAEADSEGRRLVTRLLRVPNVNDRLWGRDLVIVAGASVVRSEIATRVCLFTRSQLYLRLDCLAGWAIPCSTNLITK